MSDGTPNSTENLDGSEPSMEDILASIRKIISDDEPVALESPEDILPSNGVEASADFDLESLVEDFQTESSDLTSDAVIDAAVTKPQALKAEGESVDLNVDDILADLDDDILEESVLEDSGADARIEDLVQSDVQEDVSEVLEELADETEALSVEELESSSNVIEAESGIFDDDDDILSLLDDETSLEETAVFESAPTSSAPEASSVEIPETADESLAAADDVEMDALLDDILLEADEAEVEELAEPEALAELEALVEPEAVEPDTLVEDIELDVEDLGEDIAAVDPEGANVEIEDELAAELSSEEELSDLELVKSLMADLSDDPGETDSDLDALLAIPEVEGEVDLQDAVAADDTPYPAVTKHEPILPYEMDADFEADPQAEAEAEDDILGDILDMTLEDELKNHPDDLALADLQDDGMPSLEELLDAEQDNIAENAMPIDDAATVDDTDIDLPSLSDIAAAAEADALAVETIQASQAVAATAGLAATIGGATLGAKVQAENMPAAETAELAQLDEIADAVETAEVSETLTEHLPEPISTQETSMPVKAVKTDAILDDVTEAATAGAFAELNQVVEDKAVFNERGPRIGDLVQDALRPMLKEWLDANLKGIVERAVTKEVKRISKGG